MDPGPDPRGPKTCGYFGSGSGSPTLVTTRIWIWIRSLPWPCELLHRAPCALLSSAHFSVCCPTTSAQCICSVLCCVHFCAWLHTLLCSLFPPLLCIIRVVQVLCCALICAWSFVLHCPVTACFLSQKFEICLVSQSL